MSVKTASQCTFFVFTLVHSGPFHQWVYLPCGSIQNNRYYGQILGNCGLKRKMKRGSQPGNTDSWNRRWTVCRRCVAIDSQFSKLYFHGRNTIYWASLDWLSYHPVSPASFTSMMTRNSPSCTCVVRILSTEPCVSLDQFSYHHALPASFPPMMTRNSSKLYSCGQNSIYWALSHWIGSPTTMYRQPLSLL